MNSFSRIFRYGTFALSVAGMIMMTLVIRQIQGQERKIPPPPVPPPSKPYENTVAATGIIEARNENVAIGSPVPGLVLKVEVKVNQMVAEGAPLFHIDDRDLQALMVRQRAQVELVRAKTEVQQALLGKAQDMLDRVRAVGGKAVSLDEVQQRENDLKVSSAQLAAAEAEMEAAKADLKQTEMLAARLVVCAPRAGTVLQVNIREGEYASATPKAPLIIIGDTGTPEHKVFHVRADVDEQSAARIRSHLLNKATASIKGNAGSSFDLTFDHVEPYVIPKTSLTGASTERVDTRVLQVIFELKHDAAKGPPLYVGQQMDVFIEVAKTERN